MSAPNVNSEPLWRVHIRILQKILKKVVTKSVPFLSITLLKVFKIVSGGV